MWDKLQQKPESVKSILFDLPGALPIRFFRPQNLNVDFSKIWKIQVLENTTSSGY